MKNLIKTIVAIASFVTAVNTTALGQTTPVDANGVKVIYVDKGTKIDKLFKGDDKKLIKTLIIKGNIEYKFEVSELFKVISKLPNLENIDASECQGASEELVTDYSNVRLDKLSKLTVCPNGRGYSFARMTPDIPCSIKDYIDICSNFMSYSALSNSDHSNTRTWTLHRGMYPFLSEYKVAQLPSITEKNLPDSLYLNFDCTYGFIPVILPKEKATLIPQHFDLTLFIST